LYLPSDAYLQILPNLKKGKTLDSRQITLPTDLPVGYDGGTPLMRPSEKPRIARITVSLATCETWDAFAEKHNRIDFMEKR